METAQCVELAKELAKKLTTLERKINVIQTNQARLEEKKEQLLNDLKKEKRTGVSNSNDANKKLIKLENSIIYCAIDEDVIVEKMENVIKTAGRAVSQSLCGRSG